MLCMRSLAVSRVRIGSLHCCQLTHSSVNMLNSIYGIWCNEGLRYSSSLRQHVCPTSCWRCVMWSTNKLSLPAQTSEGSCEKISDVHSESCLMSLALVSALYSEHLGAMILSAGGVCHTVLCYWFSKPLSFSPFFPPLPLSPHPLCLSPLSLPPLSLLPPLPSSPSPFFPLSLLPPLPSSPSPFLPSPFFPSTHRL